MKTVLTIQHVVNEDLDAFADVLAAHNFQLISCFAPTANFAAIDPLEPDLLIVLGGPMGVYEMEQYPFLRAEIALLQKRLAQDLPTLGICLGCQLIASALGAKVYPMGYQEISWQPITLTPAGQTSYLAAIGTNPVLHWHGDTFDLPPDVTLLASSHLCKNQAFQWKKACLGLQFHVEVTANGLERWFVGETKLDIAAIRADSVRYAENSVTHGAEFLKTWLVSIGLLG
ncbi:MAG: glutamine amidotransferase [Beggiatoa sp. IS2]|nr:MAG: glutamine amidotransferase [Beggiatoa sp. IS2]